MFHALPSSRPSTMTGKKSKLNTHQVPRSNTCRHRASTRTQVLNQVCFQLLLDPLPVIPIRKQNRPLSDHYCFSSLVLPPIQGMGGNGLSNKMYEPKCGTQSTTPNPPLPFGTAPSCLKCSCLRLLTSLRPPPQ